jgi:aspartate beta-hydroxylase
MIVNIAAEARELLRQGRISEAESAFMRVLDAVPDHVEALNVLAMSALRGGRVRQAVELLNRAAQADPADAVTQHHLNRALDAAGDIAAALRAGETAVRLRPDFSVARLYWAASLEGAGQIDNAVVQYVRALEDAQTGGRWLSPESTPTALRSLVEHAVLTVRENRNLAFANLFEPLRERFGRESLTRVAHTLRIYFKQEPAVYPDARQRPTFLFMPGLPAVPYPDRTLFPWMTDLEGQTADIQRELRQLLPDHRGSERVFHTAELEQTNLRGADVAPSWTGYYFFRHGLRREDNGQACPSTAHALESLPLSHVRAHGPEVLFSVFTAGTHLLPHRGVTNTRLVGHLPLIIPENCALNVGGELHRWVVGRTVVFDDTYEHEAWNRGTSTRVVLIFDIWNPHLTEIERLALADVIADIGDFRETVEKA